MISVGSHPAWHPVFEALGYVVGYVVFRWARARRGDVVEEPQRWTVIAAAAVGALIGSRLLGLAEQWPTVLAAARSGRLVAVFFASGGKTIVGGLLGGWIGVELAKRFSGIHSRTGDLFALPLCAGIAVGRIGCFVAGLADDTYGKATRLPWGVNFGDGVSRHPTQLYEILFLAVLAFALTRPANWPDGYRFRLFMAGYLGWRLAIDFLKPQPLVAGMNVIQWACVAGLSVLAALCLRDVLMRRWKGAVHAAVA
ncbi:MAG TPA: prolipoprotein diacylglyceryl transferase family protein [Acidobacteriaceae bacterium]|nr:prolipoprotein diacylglyceryl transferase family protein [Acidobacteriaceae bacterium]HTW49430.1 prolipoprotein diacylglyceryl transferase family protein [Acidobacteriaceae bacterium]